MQGMWVGGMVLVVQLNFVDGKWMIYKWVVDEARERTLVMPCSTIWSGREGVASWIGICMVVLVVRMAEMVAAVVPGSKGCLPMHITCKQVELESPGCSGF